MGRIDKHYEHLNAEVLNPLQSLALENTPKANEYERTICDDYRCDLKSFPWATPLFQAAVLHLNLHPPPQVGDELEELDGAVSSYNLNVELIETFLVAHLGNVLHSQNLQYEHLPRQVLFNILRLLSHVWKGTYLDHLDEPFDSLRGRIEAELATWQREDEGTSLIVGPYTVWQEQKTGEKEQVLQVIKEVATDQEVLTKLRLLEDLKRPIERNIEHIVDYSTAISKSIESLTYTERAKCCYANIPWLIRLLV